MSYWDEAYRSIQGAQTPEQLSGLQFDTPGPIDIALGHGLRYSDLDRFKKEKLGELQQKAAFPVEQKLSDFAAQGWTSDPSFTGKEWTEGLLQTTAAPGEAAPDVRNPYIAKAISDFAGQAQKEKQYAGLLQEAGAPVQQAGELSRFAMSPAILPHLKTLEAAQGAFTRVPDTETPALRDFATGLTTAYAEAESTGDFLKKGGELLSKTQADPVKAAAMLENFSKQKITETKERPEGAPHVIEKHIGRGGLVQKFQYDPKAPGTDKFTLPIGAPYKPTAQQALEIRQTQNAMPPEHATALDTAIAQGRLDPYKVNSRNRQDLARLAYTNPGVDINTLAAQAGIARNKDVIMKAGVAEMIPDLLRKTAQAGKDLGYSDAAFIGAVQKWKNGQLNNPKLTKYMTLRNDQLLTIGGVMRSNGMTDMAQRLEEEAMKPTLSPRALDGWLEGQLESIDPRLNFYRSLTGRNKAIPRAKYEPGKGFTDKKADNRPIAPAGTKVPKRGGGFYTSDGKGGWK